MQVSGLFIALPLMITVAGCSDTEPPAEPKAPVSAAEVQKKAGDALEAAATYSDQKKEEYQQAITRQLEATEKKIDALGSQVDQAGQGTQAEWNKLVAKLQEQRGMVDKKLEQLETSGTEAWQEAKTAADSAVKELERAYEKARKRTAPES